MTAAPTCKPWCDNHKYGTDCTTRFTIYDNGEDEGKEWIPVGTSTTGTDFFQFPKNIAWINFIAWQGEEDEEPVLELQSFEAGADEPITRLGLDKNQLKEFHSSLGAILKDFS